MKQVTFITGNEKKAEYLAKYLGYPVDHQKIDLDEIQSLDLKTIVQHKVHQAYDAVKKPVIVEDVSLEFTALGRLPGPFIKWFIQELSFEQICNLITSHDRSATARCVYGYYDGQTEKYFESALTGTIPEKPSGEVKFGWDTIFVPDGFQITRANLSEEDDRKTYLRIKPLAEVKKFLESLSG